MQEMVNSGAENNFLGKGFLTPPPKWRSNWNVPEIPGSEKKPRRSPQARASDLFHVIHKVPAGDSPYVRAKHVQLIEKDPSRAISLFWSAINSGDRVDSALKDMAVVMKQLNRSDEAIEAIKSFRHLCPTESQESLDNVLIELYKKSGRIEDEIEMLQLKLRQIEEGIAFGGKHTKPARSQGKKVNITIEKEYSRLLGNLAWAYVQQKDYKSAEEFYRKALSLEPDKNKQCNLAICLMHMNKITEARFLLRAIKLSAENGEMDESYAKSYERAVQMMDEIKAPSTLKPVAQEKDNGNEAHTPVTKWNFRGLSSPCGEDQINTCGSVTSRSLSDGNKDRKFPSMKWYRGSNNWMENGPTCKKSPFPAGALPRVPYTQPRRSSWSLQKGYQSKGWSIERAVGDCSRKLSFEQPMDNKHMQFVSGVCPNKNSEDWRKRWDNERQSTFKKSAAELEQKLDENRDILTTDNGGLKKIAEHALESLKSMQQLDAANPNQMEFSSYQCKKSWADMVEEEEQELQSAISNLADQERASRYQELFECHQTITSHSYGLQDTDEQNDENKDSNIIFGTPYQPKNVTEKLGSSDLKDFGYYTQPADTAAPARQPVQRNLFFDKDQKIDRADSNCRSPQDKKSLDFDSNASMLSDGPKKLLRRNRLQVFRDITPESPRP